MKVHLHHQGACRRGEDYIHVYVAFAESGWAGLVEDEVFVKDGYYELPDDMFSADSGWVHWQCDSCGLTFWQRSRPGGKVKCPMCDTIGEVPEDAVVSEYEGVEPCQDE